MNWKTLICRIKRRGNLTDAEIAKKVRTGQQNISSLKRGVVKVPLWDLGDRLIRLWKETRSKPPVKPTGKLSK